MRANGRRSCVHSRGQLHTGGALGQYTLLEQMRNGGPDSGHLTQIPVFRVVTQPSRRSDMAPRWFPCGAKNNEGRVASRRAHQRRNEACVIAAQRPSRDFTRRIRIGSFVSAVLGWLRVDGKKRTRRWNQLPPDDGRICSARIHSFPLSLPSSPVFINGAWEQISAGISELRGGAVAPRERGSILCSF